MNGICWICESAVADSGEHKSKKSDLKAVFGEVSPQRPLYLHNSKARNRRVLWPQCPPVKMDQRDLRLLQFDPNSTSRYGVGNASRRTTKACPFETG